MGKWLDDHPGSVRLNGRARMFCSANGIAHIVQAIKEGDHVVALIGVVLRGRLPEFDTVEYPRSPGALLRLFYRHLVVVVAIELGLRKCLCHQNRGCPEATANVGNFGS